MICSNCDSEAGSKFVYKRDGDFYPQKPVCDSCYEHSFWFAVNDSIKRSKDWETNYDPRFDLDAAFGTRLNYSDAPVSKERK